MREISQDQLLLTAAFLHVPARRRRALLLGQEGALAEWLAEDSSRKVAHARHLAREAETRLHRLGARVVFYTDAEFPKRLSELHDAPAFLAVRGTLPQGGVAIVGTRDATPAAEALAHGIARDCGIPVISGLAHGVDAAAHRGALEGGNATLAYVATGLGATYPPSHKELEEAIVAARGSIASERMPDEPAAPWAFVQRDRLQAAHAQAVILIASEVDGGAMHTMRFAEELGRPRFAIVGGEFRFAGNAAAVARGARAVSPSVKEVLHAIQRVVR